MTGQRSRAINTLRVIAVRLRAGLAADAKDGAAWIDRVLERAALLLEARNRFKSNEKFSEWLTREKINIGHSNRAALLNMAKYPELARAALEKSKSVSAQLIWLDEMLPQISKQQAAELILERPEAAKVEVVLPILGRPEERKVLSVSVPLLPAGRDIAPARPRSGWRVLAVIGYLRALEALGDTDDEVRQALAGRHISPEATARLGLTLTNATRDLLAQADGTLTDFLDSRKNQKPDGAWGQSQPLSHIFRQPYF
jgi:hypothetical protein